MVCHVSEKRSLGRKLLFSAFVFSFLAASLANAVFSPVPALAISFAFAVFVVVFIIRYGWSSPFPILCLMMIAWTLGNANAWHSQMEESLKNEWFRVKIEQEGVIEGRILKTYGDSLLLKISDSGSGYDNSGIRWLVSIPSGSAAEVGMGVIIDEARPKKRLSEFEGRMSKNGVVSGYSAQSVRILEKDELTAFVDNIRKSVSHPLSELLPIRERVLAEWIVLWDGSWISKEDSDHYRKSGISHIVVASWGNIAVVAALATLLLKRFPLSVRLVFVLASIWGYALLAWFGIPIVRAGIVATLAFLSFAVMKTDSVSLLLATALAFAIMDFRITADASFLLSFVAATGIVAFSPLLKKPFSRLPETYGIRDILTTTLVATLCTIPISVALFKSASILSILTNVIALPLLVFAVVPLFPAILLDEFGFFDAGTAMGAIAYAALSLISETASFVAGLPYAAIEKIPESVATGAGMGGFLVFATLVMRCRTIRTSDPSISRRAP